MARCHGLDCLPWHTPIDSDFCFQSGNTFYAAISRPWDLPWANKKAERLLDMKGQSVEIVVYDKEITVFAAGTTVRLKMVHKDIAFRLDACTHT